MSLRCFFRSQNLKQETHIENGYIYPCQLFRNSVVSCCFILFRDFLFIKRTTLKKLSAWWYDLVLCSGITTAKTTTNIILYYLGIIILILLCNFRTFGVCVCIERAQFHQMPRVLVKFIWAIGQGSQSTKPTKPAIRSGCLRYVQNTRWE